MIRSVRYTLSVGTYIQRFIRCSLPYVLLILSFAPNEVYSHRAQNLYPVTLQLLWHHQFQFAGFYAAIKQGYFEQEGLDVTLRDGGYDTNCRVIVPVDEVLSHQAEFGISRTGLLIQHSLGKPVVM